MLPTSFQLKKHLRNIKGNAGYSFYSRISKLHLILTLLLAFSFQASGEMIDLSSLDMKNIEQGWGSPRKNMAVGKTELSITGEKFKKGLGTHAPSLFAIDLGGGSERFSAKVGVDDGNSTSPSKKGSVEFIISGDGKELWRSGVMHGNEPAQKVDIPVKGIKLLLLEVADAGDGNEFDHADWCDAYFEVIGTRPKAYELSQTPVILTPKAGPKPRINGPSLFGVRPGSPFLYTMPVTGDRPIEYSAAGLPPELKLDATTGQITGVLEKKGEFPITLRATNKLGAAEKRFRIIVGDQISLTPPMGWNSWNCWGGKVSQEKVMSSAQALVEKGLNLHGWTFINIDDGWQGVRGGKFNAVQPNAKFPDMKGLGNKLHSMGLKFGIYSSPWVVTYEGHMGSSSENADGTYNWIKSGDHNEDYRISRNPEEWNKKRKENRKFGSRSFTKEDVAQWSQWGVDYLKYDWKPIDVPHVEEMSNALKSAGRDITYSLSNDATFENASDYARLSNAWRTTGDITDTWASVFKIGFNQDQWAPYQGPGHFNDPDMLVVGQVGWGNPHPTRLSPDEQYAHISLWALLGAPLLIGCDLNKLDDFTLNLLTNDEVLEVNQDALCRQATRVARNGSCEVYAKPLEDGSWAVGLFNRGLFGKTITVNWSDIQMKGSVPHRMRDLWRQKDLGQFSGKFSAEVNPHGVVFVRIF